MKLEFTEREREVLRLLAELRTNREIAEALVISVRTAETHVGHILSKLGIQDRREAGRRAREVLENP